MMRTTRRFAFLVRLGGRSFYVIDKDKKQLIELETKSKDDLEK